MREFILKNNNIVNNSVFVSSPVWSRTIDTKEKSKNDVKKVLKIILKSFKFLIYSFLLLMGLWGCFQTIAEGETQTSVILGNGLEFGYLFGTTGDVRYDLSGRLDANYYIYAINQFNFNYGPFYALFVFPGASLVLTIMYSMKDAWGGLNALLAIFLLLLIIRVITLLISIRSTIQNEKMQEIQGKVAEINAKYKDQKDAESRQKKQIEVSAIYKKHSVKPFAAFEQIFITMPIFLIVYRVITILRPLKDTSLFNIWNLSETPMEQIFSNIADGGWVYIFFLLLVVPVQIFSQKLPQILSKKRSSSAKAISSKGNDQMKKMKTIQTVMMVFMAFILVTSATGIGLYWFLSSVFSILQTLFLHKLIMNGKKKNKKTSRILEELGIQT
ncbi:MAG: membrane protein insertase YidC [Mycoplasmoidaceae bacterium]